MYYICCQNEQKVINEMSKLSLHIERYYPHVLAFSSTLLVYLCRKTEFIMHIVNKLFEPEVLNLYITIQSIIFGFLLTVLAMSEQSSSKAIELLRSDGRIKELFKYNKTAVYSSCICIIFALFFVVTEGYVFPNIMYQLILGLFSFIINFNILATFRYLRIFYLLISI